MSPVSYNKIVCAKKAWKTGVWAAGVQVILKIGWCSAIYQSILDFMDMNVIYDEKERHEGDVGNYNVRIDG